MQSWFFFFYRWFLLSTHKHIVHIHIVQDIICHVYTSISKCKYFDHLKLQNLIRSKVKDKRNYSKKNIKWEKHLYTMFIFKPLELMSSYKCWLLRNMSTLIMSHTRDYKSRDHKKKLYYYGCKVAKYDGEINLYVRNTIPLWAAIHHNEMSHLSLFLGISVCHRFVTYMNSFLEAIQLVVKLSRNRGCLH